MDAFRRYLTDRLGQLVQLDRDGPFACQGWIVNVGFDYLTLYCFDKTRLHLPLHHIRSVTPLPKLETESDPPPPVEEWPETFADLSTRYIGQEVQLYHAGPEITIGTLLACTEDYLLVEVAPDDHVCHNRFHLRSLCLFTESPPGLEGPGPFDYPDPPEH